jgi:hypothetical protein
MGSDYCHECSCVPRSPDKHKKAHAHPDVPEVNVWRCTCGAMMLIAEMECTSCRRAQSGHRKGIYCPRCALNICLIEDWLNHQAVHNKNHDPILLGEYRCPDCDWTIKVANRKAHEKICAGVSRKTGGTFQAWRLSQVDEAARRKAEAARKRREAREKRKKWEQEPWDFHVESYLSTGDRKHLDQALKRELPSQITQAAVIWGDQRTALPAGSVCEKCGSARVHAMDCPRGKPVAAAPAVVRKRPVKVIRQVALAPSMIMMYLAIVGAATNHMGTVLIPLFLMFLFSRIKK